MKMALAVELLYRAGRAPTGMLEAVKSRLPSSTRSNSDGGTYSTIGWTTDTTSMKLLVDGPGAPLSGG